MEIDFEPRALKALRKVHQPDQARIVNRIGSLAADPRPANGTKLVGLEDAWRVRQGDYRIIYTIDDAAGVITITKIGQRGDVYRD